MEVAMPSTVIARFEYDARAERLMVTFVTGRVYEYADVPVETFRAFRSAFSKGKFFNEHIRDRYVCRELTRTAD
jgi:lysyl-tRNA synthetase class 2